jgi:hypothetical protein
MAVGKNSKVFEFVSSNGSVYVQLDKNDNICDIYGDHIDASKLLSKYRGRALNAQSVSEELIDELNNNY